MKAFQWFAFMMLMPFLIYGQDQKQDSITSLKEVILLEQGLSKSAVGITPYSKIGIKDIGRNGPLDIASTFNQISGVYVLSGALNTNRITIRGIGARTPYGTNKLRLYFNNIPVTNGTGFSTIEAFDLQNIGEIEVIKGPKGTNLGANLGGGLVLKTLMPKVGRSFLTNTFTMGSYGLFKDKLSFSHSETNFNLSISYNHLITEGYRQNNHFKRDGLLLNSMVKLGKRGKFDFLLNYIDYTAEIPSSLNRNDFEENPTKAADNWLATQGYEANKYTLAGLTYTHMFNSIMYNKTSIYYTYLDHYEPRPFNILDEFTNGFGIRSVIEGNLFNGNFVFGGELYKDEYHWKTFENMYEENERNGSLQGAQMSKNMELRRQFNLFTSFTYPFSSKFSAQFGLNLNKTHYDFRDLFSQGEGNASAQRDFDPIVLPNLEVTYQLKNGRVFGNISRGFSNPSLEETLTPEGIINKDISQEKGVSYELGTELSMFYKLFTAKITLYSMDIKNLLVAQRVEEDQYIGRNAGKTRHQGVEVDLQYRTNLSQEITFSPYISYTLNNHSFIDFVDGGNDYSGNPLTGVPKHRISSGIDVQHSNGLVINFNHQFVDEIPLTDANSVRSDAYHVFNISTKYSQTLLPKLNIELSAGINNLFDVNYARSVLINANGFGGSLPRYFYPGNNRNLYYGLGVTYSF